MQIGHFQPCYAFAAYNFLSYSTEKKGNQTKAKLSIKKIRDNSISLFSSLTSAHRQRHLQIESRTPNGIYEAYELNEMSKQSFSYHACNFFFKKKFKIAHKNNA